VRLTLSIASDAEKLDDDQYCEEDGDPNPDVVVVPIVDCQTWVASSVSCLCLVSPEAVVGVGRLPAAVISKGSVMSQPMA
jgi:hypothetical protein